MKMYVFLGTKEIKLKLPYLVVVCRLFAIVFSIGGSTNRPAVFKVLGEKNRAKKFTLIFLYAKAENEKTKTKKWKKQKNEKNEKTKKNWKKLKKWKKNKNEKLFWKIPLSVSSFLCDLVFVLFFACAIITFLLKQTIFFVHFFLRFKKLFWRPKIAFLQHEFFILYFTRSMSDVRKSRLCSIQELLESARTHFFGATIFILFTWYFFLFAVFFFFSPARIRRRFCHHLTAHDTHAARVRFETALW